VYKRSLEDKSGNKSKEKAQDTEDEESDEEELEDDTEEPKDEEELEDDEEEIEFKVVDECDEGHQEEEDPDFEPDSEEEQVAGDQSEVEPETVSKSVECYFDACFFFQFDHLITQKYGKRKHVHETEIPTSTTMKLQVRDQEERVHEKKRRGEGPYGENFREWEERSGDELSEDMMTVNKFFGFYLTSYFFSRPDLIAWSAQKLGKKKRISKTKVSALKPVKAPVTIRDQEERVHEKNPIVTFQIFPRNYMD